MFYLAQAFGLVSLAIVILSYYQRQKKSFTHLQTFSNLSSSVQYFLLGAYSGCLICLACVVRNLVIGRTKKKANTWFIVAFLLAIILLSVLNYDGPVSLLPLLATGIFTFAIWLGSLKTIRQTNLLCCLIALAYKILVGAYVGALAVLVEFFVTLITLVKFNLHPCKLSHH